MVTRNQSTSLPDEEKQYAVKKHHDLHHKWPQRETNKKTWLLLKMIFNMHIK